MTTLILLAVLAVSDDDSPSVRALRAMPNISRDSGTYEWTGKEWVYRESKPKEADKPTESTIERYAGTYEWTGYLWLWTSETGERYWHDGRTWRKLADVIPPTATTTRQTQSRPAPRVPQNRYGIQWSK